MSNHSTPLHVIPGTVVEALDWAIGRPWASYRLVLTLDDLTPGGEYTLVGTWAQRHNPDTLTARLADLGIQPATTHRRPT